MLRVVELHGDARKGTDRIVYCAEYEIETGPNAGYRRRSELTSYPAVPTAGDHAAGLHNPKTSELETHETLKHIAWFERVLQGLSAGIILFGLIYVAM